jgi:hypothetical protein
MKIIDYSQEEEENDNDNDDSHEVDQAMTSSFIIEHLKRTKTK